MARLAPLWLICGREFRAYVATISFWVALMVGPLVGIVIVLIANPAGPQNSIGLRIVSTESELAAHAATALQTTTGAYRPATNAPSTLTLSRSGDAVIVSFSGAAVPDAASQTLFARTLERDLVLDRLRLLGGATPVVTVAPQAPIDAGAAASKIARLIMAVTLWLTLAGSLGMLLQAVVRERANRALETLLASAPAWQIVIGKLLGIGAVSLIILVGWVGSGIGITGFASGDGVVGAVGRAVADPALLAMSALGYALAYLLFGLATIAVGAGAADSASAQNHARPMFAVLLLIFFVAVSAGTRGAMSIEGLACLPPFTPFLMLLTPMSPAQVAIALSLNLLAIAAAGLWACRRLDPAPAPIATVLRSPFRTS